jgi:hypothetical protein
MRWLRLTLLSAAACSAAIIVRQLYTGGARLFGTRPSIYLFAVVAGIFLAAAMLVVPSWRRAPALAAALSFALFVSNGRRINSGDTKPAALVPYALVRNGTFSLDGLVERPLPYWVVESGGRIWSRYPIAAPLLALPVYLPSVLGSSRAGSSPHSEKIAAALIAALSVGFVLAALSAAGAPRWLVATGTALYAAASPALSVLSQALWQHGPGALGIAVAIWAALRARADSRFSSAAGLAAGLAAAARPTNAIVTLALLAWAATRGRAAALRYAAAASIPALLTAAYDAAAFGAPWRTGYGGEATAFDHPFGAGLAGVLLSPTRGLLPYVPWALFGIAGLALGARRDWLWRALLAGFVSVVALYAKWHEWSGGSFAYGPRLLSDLTPILAVGLAPLAAAPRRWLAAPLAVAGLAGGWMAGLGAFGYKTPAASAVYDAVGDEVMDWSRYPLIRPFAHGARGEPVGPRVTD